MVDVISQCSVLLVVVCACAEKHGSVKRERRYKCGSCTYTAYTRSILQRHEARHAPCRRPQYSCDVCSARLMTVYSLNEHKRLSHVDDRPFPCAICGFTAKCQCLSLTVGQSCHLLLTLHNYSNQFSLLLF